MCVRVFLFAQVVEGDVCASGKFTSSGECCSLCPRGMGVASNCELEDTKCQPCQEGECSIYSSEISCVCVCMGVGSKIL